MHAFYHVFIIIIGITGTDLGSMAQPQVLPKNLIEQMGTVSRFNCTAAQNEPVYWVSKPYGSTATYDIYIGEQYLVDDYGRSGRFLVEVNSTIRRYDLFINNTMQKDGGVYVCIDGRGLGKKAYAELVVYGRPICQKDDSQESYIGDNVFDLNPGVMHFSCRMNYSGNLRPRFEWSVGDKTFAGTRGSESDIASSSLELVPRSIYNDARLTWKAVFQEGSDDVGRTGILWTSDPIRIHYAQWTNRAVKECQGIELILDCNPPCSYELESLANGTKCCLMNYSTGNDFHQILSCVNAVISSETTGVSNDLMIAIILGVLGTVIALCVGIMVGCLCGKKCERFKSRCIAGAENGQPDTNDLEMSDVDSTSRPTNNGTAAERAALMNAGPSSSETKSNSGNELNPTPESRPIEANSTTCTPAENESNYENSSPAANDSNSINFSPATNDSNSKTLNPAENESNSAAQNGMPNETIPAS